MKQHLRIDNLPFASGHELQGAIEHFCEILKANRVPRRFGENRISYFDIEYYGKMLIELVRIREHIEIINEEDK